ncbi:MAG: bifunctional precorrin-2 dehydrogenase/sirohydrochlorin ferrochelatase [Nitrospinae bacterium]|nr:bifunctional precorrin-2 dehydrogenase/sirohydrochlorin ferrochelatase [Nitrospinota bacterium]
MIIDLNLKGKQVLVLGGGNEAARKVEALLTQDCAVIVVAERVAESIRVHAENGKITLENRRVEEGSFLDGYDRLILVLAVTDDEELNRRLVDAAKERRCYVYAADDPEASDFAHPAVINIEDTVAVAISTGGKSPLMAKTLREKVEPILQQAIDHKIILQIRLQDRMRTVAREKLSTTEDRRNFLVMIRDDERINRLLEADRFEEAETLARECLEGW